MIQVAIENEALTELLTSAEACAYAKICRKTLNNWIDRGLEHTRGPKRLYTTRRSILNFFERLSVPQSQQIDNAGAEAAVRQYEAMHGAINGKDRRRVSAAI